jgi:Developmentally Regulated MAPK Interacting Protein.
MTRLMIFRVTARDNRTVGAINSDDMFLNIDGNSGPFNITAPNTQVRWTANSAKTVTWNVANTDNAPVNAASVRILLSTDGGNTFPLVLNPSTPNDGSEVIVVPNTGTPSARIKVEAVGNVFFDISDTNFTILAAPVPSRADVLDFDGDNKTDAAVIRDSGGSLNWYLQQSLAGFAGQPWGIAGDRAVPADFDGDGKWDITIWRPGSTAYFYILKSLTGTFDTVAFGTTGDDPRVTQDFDGDGKADPAVTRNAGGALSWYILRSSLGFTGVMFGNVDDSSIRSDFDGDGKADIGVYRNAAGSAANTFFIVRSSDGTVLGQNFGNSNTDHVVPADFDGDGKTDFAVYRFGGTDAGNWYWLRSSDGAFAAVSFGIAGDFPVPGDYDGDGRTDEAVWRPGSPSVFYLNRSSNGFASLPFGNLGDIVPGYTLQAR